MGKAVLVIFWLATGGDVPALQQIEVGNLEKCASLKAAVLGDFEKRPLYAGKVTAYCAPR
jgi:hypothetical protein